MALTSNGVVSQQFANQASAASPLSPTSPVAKIPWMETLVRSLSNDAQRGVAARGFAFATNAKVDQWSHNYHTGKPKEMNLLSAPANNKLQLTVAMHVSGHTSQATEFASNPRESFTITVTAPGGQQRSEVVNVGGAPGKPVYALTHDIEIDVSQPGNYTIGITPSATSVGGYIEGREYHLHVGQQNFFKPQAPPPGFQLAPGATYPYPIDEISSVRYRMGGF